ncbi:hypothetical protein CR513_20861, partial [Mucuna pruriens]
MHQRKTNKQKKLGAKKAKDVLELIHTNICGLFPTTSWNGQQYFITFIDDYSRYNYLYLIHEKSQSINIFKSLKAEVELQLGNKIKAIKSSHGGEYYGRYDGSGEQHCHFALFPKSKPSMNNVAEQQNQTLKDMQKAKHQTLTHLRCPVEAQPYKSHERKLDSRIVSCYFVDYAERSRGYKFYNPTSRSFFEMGNVRILEEVEFEKEENIRNVVFEEEFVNDIGQVLLPITIQETTLVIGDNVQIIVFDIVPKQDYDGGSPLNTYSATSTTLKSVIKEIHKREETCNSKHKDDIGLTKDDPINFCQAMQSSNSKKWIDAMKDEMKSIQDNDIWDLVELPKGDNIERYEACLVVKCFTQKEDFDYKKIFSLVSSKDSFRTIMTLVVHFYLVVHQMNVKIAFLNGDIDEKIIWCNLKTLFQINLSLWYAN